MFKRSESKSPKRDNLASEIKDKLNLDKKGEKQKNSQTNSENYQNDFNLDSDFDTVESDNESIGPENLHHTLSSKFGRNLLDITANVRKLSKKSGIPAKDINIDEVSKNYQEFLTTINNTIQSKINDSKLDINAAISKITADEENIDYQETIFPPKIFAPVDALTNNEFKRSNAQNSFPIKRPFNHKAPNSATIAEHLRNLNNAQEDCILSLKEFKRYLLKSFTNESYEFIASLLDGNLPLEDIYSNLLTKYDVREKPYVAKQKLENYKAPPTASLHNIQSDILSLGQRAMLVHRPEARTAVFNEQTISALQKVLPKACEPLLLATHDDCHRKFKRSPTFSEFIKMLNKHAPIINHHISETQTKHDNRSKYDKFKYSNTPYEKRLNRHSINNIQGDNNNPNWKTNHSNNSALLRENNATQHNHNYEYNNYTKHNGQRGATNVTEKLYSAKTFRDNKYNINNMSAPSKNARDNFAKNFPTFGGPKYHHRQPQKDERNTFSCVLCGIVNHDATRCEKMRLDNGKIKVVTPTSKPCETCLKETNKVLLHPESLCFLRPAFVQARREGKHLRPDRRIYNKEYNNRFNDK